MTERLPAVFVSSTFFDLRQLRADLGDFITGQLGYRLLASEFSTFPIDPSVDTIENCRRRVGDADLLILAIGTRFGSRSTSGHSVTNLEYLVARERGIPIYVYVLKEVLALVRVWHGNKDADFSAVVDSPDLFRFVSEIASDDRVWITPFETAQDITASLRLQLGYLMTRGLTALARLHHGPENLDGFSGEALRLILEKPETWLSDVFCLLLNREFEAAALLRERHRTRVALGPGEHVPPNDAARWVKSRMNEVVRDVGEIEILVRESVNSALHAKDPQSLRRAAQHLGAVYRECLEWAARVRRAEVPDHWRSVTALLARVYDSALDSLEKLPANFQSEVQRILASGVRQDVRIRLPFVLELPDEFAAAFSQANAED